MRNFHRILLAGLASATVVTTYVHAHDEEYEAELQKDIMASDDAGLRKIQDEVKDDKKRKVIVRHFARHFGPGGAHGILQQLIHFAEARGGNVTRDEFCAFLGVLETTNKKKPAWKKRWDRQMVDYADAYKTLLGGGGGKPCGAAGAGAFAGATSKDGKTISINTTPSTVTFTTNDDVRRDFTLSNLKFKVGATQLTKLLDDLKNERDPNKSNYPGASPALKASISSYLTNPGAFEQTTFSVVSGFVRVKDYSEPLAQYSDIIDGAFFTPTNTKSDEGVAIFKTSVTLDTKKAAEAYHVPEIGIKMLGKPKGIRAVEQK